MDESRPSGLTPSVGSGFFELCGDPAELVEEPPVAEPVDLFQDGQFDVVSRFRTPSVLR